MSTQYRHAQNTLSDICTRQVHCSDEARIAYVTHYSVSQSTVLRYGRTSYCIPGSAVLYPFTVRRHLGVLNKIP